MEPNHSDDMEGFVDESSDQLNPPYSAYLTGINGDPEVFPRVGDLYQADIPVLVPQYERLKLIKCFESESQLQNMPTFGLPIPLMWTRSEKFRGFRETDSDKRFPSTNLPLLKEAEPAASLKPRSILLALPCQRNAKFKFDWLDKSLYPFPGTLGESWADAEQQRFLLGLYCLGKNLVLVQRFVGSKQMGDMLSYYYGSFYRSNDYRRWVDGRKSRSRRSVQGQKLLSGWRQQELLSRILSHVSEECKNTLLKVSKAFTEDKISLEDYIFTLKNNVGIDMLTEVFGIGKGKRDLTCALEPTKLNHNTEVRICNDLPIADIVKYLTGEYRMSKTKSSDLFWEAVWPRLLARGWHSEQPKDGPRNSLVFLIPEASKFSRRKMSKGNHYFDSLTDVLNKVALDPTLLELKTDEDVDKKGSKEEIIKNELPIKLVELDDSSPNSKKKKRYLQPRSKTSTSQEVLMFTIVDTSEANGVEGCKLKELRALPVGTGSSIAHSPSYLSESEGNLSEESENKAETTSKSMTSRGCGGGSLSSGKSSCVNMDNATSRSTISLNERQQKNRKSGRPRNSKLSPVCGKRSSLADCTLRESGCFGETQSRKKKKVKKGTQMSPNPLEADLNVMLMREEHKDQDQTLKLSSTSSFAVDSSCRRNEGCEISPGISETREDFDLNISQISIEREVDGTNIIMTDVFQNSESSSAEQSSVQMDVEMQCKSQEPQVTLDLLPGRRQSTRTRPLTTKALEAFAFGYLGNSKKKKASEESISKSRAKSTKRIHHNSLVSSDFRNGTVEDGSNTDENE